MEKKVSPTSTKSEIMDAYNELLKKLEEQKTTQPKEENERSEKESVVKTALSNNKDNVIKQIANLKIQMAGELEKIEDTLVTEYKKMTNIQEAIQIQEQRLKDLYQVNATADSLTAMLALQNEKRSAFEKEMEQKRQNFDEEILETRQRWEKDKKETDTALKEEKDRTQKQRKREEEEYTYNLELVRRKDTDLYQQKKSNLEKELTDKKLAFDLEIKSREQAVAGAEAELKELREKAISFPKIMEQAVKESVVSATEKLQSTYQFESQLKAKGYESDIKLRDQEIASLKAKVKDLETQISQFAAKAEQADKSAKDIAIRAIESSSNVRIIERPKETREEVGK